MLLPYEVNVTKRILYHGLESEKPKMDGKARNPFGVPAIILPSFCDQNNVEVKQHCGVLYWETTDFRLPHPVLPMDAYNNVALPLTPVSGYPILLPPMNRGKPHK